MNLELGQTYTINGIDYYVVAYFKEYALIMNGSASKLNNSGDLVAVKFKNERTLRVIKDRVTIDRLVKKIVGKC